MQTQRLDVTVGGQDVHLLATFAERPRAVIFALHGGNSSKEYFDAPAEKDLSLFALGAALGFTVLAPDRPTCVRGGEEAIPADARTDLLYATLDAALAGRSRGGGVLVLGHSLGCVSGLRMAAERRGTGLIGLELSGTGLAYSDAAVAASRAEPGRQRRSLRRLIWGPDELYPAGTRANLPVPPTTRADYDDADGWSQRLPELARAVSIPVRYCLAENETWWCAGSAALREVRALFTAAPFVETAIEPDAGHNISLGVTAREYHLRVLAFAERCIRHARATAAPVRGLPA